MYVAAVAPMPRLQVVADTVAGVAVAVAVAVAVGGTAVRPRRRRISRWRPLLRSRHYYGHSHYYGYYGGYYPYYWGWLVRSGPHWGAPYYY